MNKFVAVLFGISCVATSLVSGSLLGVGMWFWIIIVSGLFVMISQFYPKLSGLGTVLALIASCMFVLTGLLGLAAATAGGSFSLEGSAAALLILFFIDALFGILLAVMYKKPIEGFRA